MSHILLVNILTAIYYIMPDENEFLVFVSRVPRFSLLNKPLGSHSTTLKPSLFERFHDIC